MNTKQRTLKLTLIGLLLAGALSACGKIPEAYRGDFSDAATGAKLNIGSSDGTLTLAGGRQVKADADTLDFDNLVQGKPGIYLRPTQDNADELEVFWLFPRKETRKQDQDFVWVDAEVMYSRMDSKQKDAVQQMKMIHCEDGMLMLDLPTKTWNGGCPAGAQTLDFVRTK